jgi:hypothetical protein
MRNWGSIKMFGEKSDCRDCDYSHGGNVSVVESRYVSKSCR